MSSDQALFNAQKSEFDKFTELYHEKVTRMYLRLSEDGKTFDARIHEIWDNWDIIRRKKFINDAYKQLEQSQSSKELTVLAKTCPEIINHDYLACETDSISKFLQAVAYGKENDSSYPWYSLVKENITGLLDDLHWDLWKTFTDKNKKKQYTMQLMFAQRTMYINQVAVYLIANFCGEFTGSGSLPKSAGKCIHCAKPMTQRKRCGRCKKVFYCSKECQLNHWPSHRGVCKA